MLMQTAVVIFHLPGSQEHKHAILTARRSQKRVQEQLTGKAAATAIPNLNGSVDTLTIAHLANV